MANMTMFEYINIPLIIANSDRSKWTKEDWVREAKRRNPEPTESEMKCILDKFFE